MIKIDFDNIPVLINDNDAYVVNGSGTVETIRHIGVLTGGKLNVYVLPDGTYITISENTDYKVLADNKDFSTTGTMFFSGVCSINTYLFVKDKETLVDVYHHYKAKLKELDSKNGEPYWVVRIDDDDYGCIICGNKKVENSLYSEKFNSLERAKAYRDKILSERRGEIESLLNECNKEMKQIKADFLPYSLKTAINNFCTRITADNKDNFIGYFGALEKKGLQKYTEYYFDIKEIFKSHFNDWEYMFTTDNGYVYSANEMMLFRPENGRQMHIRITKEVILLDDDIYSARADLATIELNTKSQLPLSGTATVMNGIRINKLKSLKQTLKRLKKRVKHVSEVTFEGYKVETITTGDKTLYLLVYDKKKK